MDNQRDDSGRRTQPNVAEFEDGGRGHEPRNVGQLPGAGKGKEAILPQSLQKECST